MKELKRLFTRKTIHKRVLSSLLAMLLVITSVVHPINMVPAYATGDWLDVDYQKQDKNDLELYVQTESASFEPGETVVFDLFVQNNSSEEYTDFGISFRDKKDAFAEAEFILTDACGEAYITEKGSVTNLYLAPGETKALQFEGTLNDDLDVLDRKEIAFFCGGYDGNEEAVTVTTEFPFTVGLFNELSIDFTDGTELIPDENNTLEITIGFNDIGYYYDTEVATDSNAKVETDSDTDLATDSDAKVATDSDADEDYVFDLTNVTLDLETVGVKFENVKLADASIDEQNGTITAQVSYKVDEDAEAGEYFGTVTANVKNGKKVYQAQKGFQVEVEEVSDSTFKKSGLFTAELENFTVNVEVAKGAFDEKVELAVTELEEDSEAFKTAEEAMEASEREFDGMMALDICFINGDGEEVEPNEGYSVQVSIEMKAEVLPEDAIDTSLMVHHLAENTTDNEEKEIVVEDVADVQTTTEGTIEVKEEVIEAKFEVDNFSTYAVTYALARATEISGTDANVIVKMYNYDRSVNTRDDRIKTMYFWQSGSRPSVDGPGDDPDGETIGGMKGRKYSPIMKKYLDDQGYPDTEDGSMAYLFNETYHKGTMSTGGGLFQKDEAGYYYYDSALNAASYNKESNRFTLYDHVISPDYSNNSSDPTSGDGLSNYFPFNNASNYITSKKYTNSEGKTSYKLNEDPDLWFGMTVEFEFYMPKNGLVNGSNMVFDFHGDDDVYVFIDDVLVLDIGGVHGAMSGNIDFNSGNVNYQNNRGSYSTSLAEIFKEVDGAEITGNTFTDYSKHKLKFFYMERGGYISYCRLKFNIPSLPEKSLTVTKELIADGSEVIQEYVKESVIYKYRVVKADDLNSLYVTPGATYNIIENFEVVDQGTVDENGYFYLKADQSAQFTDMKKYGNINSQYIVQEILPDNVNGQYSGVEYIVSGAGGSTKTEEKEEKDFTAYSTDALKASETQAVFYRNKVDTSKMSALSITKLEAPGSELDDNETFDIKVELGSTESDKDLSLIPIGTQYRISGEAKPKTVTKEGIIPLKIGQTATLIDGILAGTYYRISEDLPTGSGINASYTGKIETKDETKGEVHCDKDKVTGYFTPEDTVSVTVTNSDFDFSAEIDIYKKTEGFASEINEFLFAAKPCDANGNLLSNGNTLNTSISIEGNTTEDGAIIVGFKSTAVTNGEVYYYEITEVEGSDEKVEYDKTRYIVGIQVTLGENNKAEIVSVKKDGKDISPNSNLVFTNIYDNTTKVTISKRVTGNLGDWSKEFTFTATLDDGVFPAEYVAYLTDEPSTSTSVTYIPSGNTAQIILKHNETIELKLPVESKLTVVETSYDGYTTSNTIDGVKSTEDNYKAVIQKLEKSESPVAIVYVNHNDAKPDTGISMDTLPYILIMLAVIGGIAFTVIRKRKDDELD